MEVIVPVFDENEEFLSEENHTNQTDENVSTNKYYYKQLNTPAKIIYRGLEDNLENMKSGNYKIEFGTDFNDLLNNENGEENLKTAFQSAWNAFTYDYPNIFYIDVTKLVLTTQTTTIGTYSTHKVDLSSGDNINYFREGISSKEDLKKKEIYIENIRKQFIEQLKDYSTEEKIKRVHDWLVDNLEYDESYSSENNHDVYGAFANKKVVCEGYARAFKYILDGLEIENVLVSGEATNSNNVTESHAWNYVNIDGKWYAIDVTWDDPIISGGGKLTNKHKYMYFLKGSKDFFENHEEDGYLSKNSIKFEFPKLERKNYNE